MAKKQHQSSPSPATEADESHPSSAPAPAQKPEDDLGLGDSSAVSEPAPQDPPATTAIASEPPQPSEAQAALVLSRESSGEVIKVRAKVPSFGAAGYRFSSTEETEIPLKDLSEEQKDRLKHAEKHGMLVIKLK